MLKEKTLKNINIGLYVLGMGSYLLFLLAHYGYVNLSAISGDPKGYFLLIPVFAISILATSVIEIMVKKRNGEKIGFFSIAIDVLIFGALIAYAIYLYNMPVGFCTIRAFFSNGGFSQTSFE